MRWVENKDGLPVHNYGDYSREYIIKGYNFDSKYNHTIIECYADEIEEKCAQFDWFYWLDEETPSPAEQQLSELRSLLSIKEGEGIVEGVKKLQNKVTHYLRWLTDLNMALGALKANNYEGVVISHVQWVHQTYLDEYKAYHGTTNKEGEAK